MDLQVWKNSSNILSNTLHIIFEITLFFMGYFPKIKTRIYSEDLPGRNSRIKLLFSVIVIGRGNFWKKNHSNNNHID